ncbi:hypothetical protein DPMN_087098 [Dreissena polymorpha]|uniref:Uncharacterized protein n=1 Tax=Dreissena polymorpha TaxID=45954 RepID=A0A9D4KSM0_DREPO|nr:hypothetical protein DPMN_087098 [Dreissena polymorpha]
MLQLVYILGSIIFLANSGQCELTWDTVYNLLSSRLDNIVFDVKSKENSMSRQISDLMETVTATNQQLATFEQRLSDVAKCSQQWSIFEKKLDDMDSHVIGIAAAEIGRRMSLFRRGLEQEKATSQSRFDFVRKMQETAQSDINFVMTAANEMQV